MRLQSKKLLFNRINIVSEVRQSRIKIQIATLIKGDVVGDNLHLDLLASKKVKNKLAMTVQLTAN